MDGNPYTDETSQQSNHGEQQMSILNLAEKELLPLTKGVVTQIHHSDNGDDEYIGIGVRTGAYDYLHNFFNAAKKVLTDEQNAAINKEIDENITDIEEKIIWILRDFEGNGSGAWEVVDKKQK